MNAPEGVLSSAIFSNKHIEGVLDGLEGQQRILVQNLIEKVRTAGIEQNLSAVNIGKESLRVAMILTYGDSWPQWADRLNTAIRHLENRMQQSGIPAISDTVARTLPQAATWEPENDFRRGARAVGLEEGPQAAELPRQMGTGATVA